MQDKCPFCNQSRNSIGVHLRNTGLCPREKPIPRKVRALSTKHWPRIRRFLMAVTTIEKYNTKPELVQLVKPLFEVALPWMLKHHRSPEFPSEEVANTIFAYKDCIRDGLKGELLEAVLHHGSLERFLESLPLTWRHLQAIKDSPGVWVSSEQLLAFAEMFQVREERHLRTSIRRSVQHGTDKIGRETWDWKAMESDSFLRELSWTLRVPQDEWPMLAHDAKNPLVRKWCMFLLNSVLED